MGYALTYPSKYYVPTDDSVIEDTVAVAVSNGTYAKKKEFTLAESVHPDSRFRFVLEISNGGGGTCYGWVYKNDSPIGVEQSTVSGGYEVFSQDIQIGGWAKGDTISLWCRQSLAALSGCRLFRIAGIGSEWVKTLP